MKEKTTEELIAELMISCGFGNIISPIEPVSGGFMHRMYRVRTDHGIYAVKHLNPQIMAREGVHDNFERAYSGVFGLAIPGWNGWSIICKERSEHVRMKQKDRWESLRLETRLRG